MIYATGEMASRRRELESWDQLLRDKDAKINKNRQTITSRESALHESEEALKISKAELDTDMRNLRAHEKTVREKEEGMRTSKNDLEKRELTLESNTKKYQADVSAMDKRDMSLVGREQYVAKLISQLQDLESRENDLAERVTDHKRKEDEFFNVRVQQITTRHAREMSELETIVNSSYS